MERPIWTCRWCERGVLLCGSDPFRLGAANQRLWGMWDMKLRWFRSCQRRIRPQCFQKAPPTQVPWHSRPPSFDRFAIASHVAQASSAAFQRGLYFPAPPWEKRLSCPPNCTSADIFRLRGWNRNSCKLWFNALMSVVQLPVSFFILLKSALTSLSRYLIK